MIDNLLIFTDETTAQTDSVLSQWYSTDYGWRGDIIEPSVQVWDSSLDNNGIHTYVSGWAIIVSLNDQSLANHPNLILMTDRAAAVAGQPFVLKSTLTDTQMSTYMLQPVPLGSNYPFGNPQ